MITKKESYTQVSPTLLWAIPVPIGARFIQIDGLFDNTGKYSEVENELSTGGGFIYIDFSIQPFAGTIFYTYRIDGEEPKPNATDNITINNNINSDVSNNHEIITIENIRAIEVENNGIHSRGLKVYQYIETIDGIKSYQDYTSSVDIFYKEKINDGKKFIRIESNIPITGFIELY